MNTLNHKSKGRYDKIHCGLVLCLVNLIFLPTIALCDGEVNICNISGQDTIFEASSKGQYFELNIEFAIKFNIDFKEINLEIYEINKNGIIANELDQQWVFRNTIKGDLHTISPIFIIPNNETEL